VTNGIDNLPAEIVRRLLAKGSQVAAKSAARAAEFAQAREQIRDAISDLIAEVDVSVLERAGSVSVSAVDGGMVNDSKSIGDLCTAVGVSVGPGRDDCDCNVWMESVSRHASNADILRGIMSSMEIALAADSRADVVLVDGSMLSALFNVAHAIASSSRASGPMRDRIMETATPAFRDAVTSVLSSSRYVAMPKYTTTNEFADRLPGWLASQDARTVATMALKPGEMTHFSFREYGAEVSRGRFSVPPLGFSDGEREWIASAMNGVISCYYRPHPWTPAFRLDMTSSASGDGGAQLRALKAVWDTTNHATGLREPFPLYLADLFAKQVSVGAAPVVEMSALSAIGDADAKLLLAMGYRS